MSLTVKFSLFITILVFFILTTVTIVLTVVRTQQIKEQLVEKDRISSLILSRELSDSFGDYYFYQYDTYRDFVKKKLSQYEDVLHFALYNTAGEKLFDSQQLDDPPGTPPIPPQKVTDVSMSDIIAAGLPYENTVSLDNTESIHIMQPYIDKLDVYRNMVEIHYSLKKVEESIRQTVIFSVILLGILSIISVAGTVVLVRQITKPVTKLTQAAEHFSSGNLDYTVESASGDEIGKLANAFKQMAADLKLSQAKLKEHNENLENEVENRTRELKDHIAEMERLQKLTIDRELKMVEMKKELEALKTKVS